MEKERVPEAESEVSGHHRGEGCLGTGREQWRSLGNQQALV